MNSALKARYKQARKNSKVGKKLRRKIKSRKSQRSFTK